MKYSSEETGVDGLAVHTGVKMNRILSWNHTFCERLSRIPWQDLIAHKNDNTSFIATCTHAGKFVSY